MDVVNLGLILSEFDGDMIPDTRYDRLSVRAFTGGLD